MVSDKGDIPDRADVTIESNGDLVAGRVDAIQQLLERGETMARLEDGTVHELHGYDTYVFPESWLVYTQDEDDDEIWFFIDDIVELRQH